MKKIAILGSTGSIGTQTLEVVDVNADLQVTALSARHNIGLLEEQIRKYRPVMAAVWEEEQADILRTRVADTGVKIYAGMDGLKAVAADNDADILVTAIVGMIGIIPTIEAIRAGKDIALANKETLATAGHIIMPMAKEAGVRILPVDSEHSAIFQCLQGASQQELEKILLTASGGPFRGMTYDQLKTRQVEDALRHPNWSMGKKITIDSASMVNKGLEVMEAAWLFGTQTDHIQVVIEPRSVIHSMVQFKDGAVIAQMGTPDMKLPIQYALLYPERRYMAGERLDFWNLGPLAFEKPDMEVFRGLALALQAAQAGGSVPTVFNAANEKAVAMFLNRQIAFTQIYDIIADCMEKTPVIPDPSVEEILETERRVYEMIRGWQ